MRLRKTFAEISKSALLNNVQYVKSHHVLNEKFRNFFCPMIKANAYGHGDILVARILEPHCSHFGVVLVEEGLRLREAGIQKPILIFGPLYNSEQFKLCEEKKLTPILSSLDQLLILQEVSFLKKITVHLKFDTGMSRLGFQEFEVDKLVTAISNVKHLQVEGICTHFLNSEDFGEEGGYSQNQLLQFQKIEHKLRGLYQFSHCLNSAALFRLHLRKNSENDSLDFLGARPGISLYGFTGGSQRDERLVPVMTLKTYVAQIRKIPKGSTVSYGATWKSSKDSWIATVGIGYGDGYFRSLSNLSEMQILNHKVSLVGRVCMDYCMLDITDHPKRNEITVGTEVVAFGSTLVRADDLSCKIDSIPYEILSHLGSRIPRVEVA